MLFRSLLNQAVSFYEQVKETSSEEKSKRVIERVEHAAYAQLGEWEKIIASYDQYSTHLRTAADKGSWIFLKAWLTEERIKDPKEAWQLYQSFNSFSF